MLVLHTKNSIKAKIRKTWQSQLQRSKTARNNRQWTTFFFCFTKMAKYDLCENCSSELLVCSMSPSRVKIGHMETNYWTCYTCIHFKVHFYWKAKQ